jgi:hypothetical protein
MKKCTFLLALLWAFAAPATATTFIAQYVPPAANTSVSGAPAPATGRPPGLYVQVIDGLIHLTNSGGAQQLTAGQFGYTASVQTPPVLVPSNPALQFTLPPVFSTPAGPSSSTATKSNSVDCEVR